MNTQLAPVEYRDMTAPDGRHVLHLRVDRHHTHTAVTVITPMDTSLDRAFPTTAETDAYLAFLDEQVASNTPLWQIEHNAGVLTSTVAALDSIDVELIAAVNEVMDRAAADTIAEREQERASVADIVNGPRDGWHRMRQATTRTGRPTSQPMDRILDSAVNGYIPRGRSATSRQLVALADRGKVVLDWQTRNRERQIAGAWIAGQQPEQVAA
jgi:hypothetical protein